MKFLVVPDSFKGSISSSDFCRIAVDVISKKQGFEVTAIPVCDGGEGSIECLTSLFDGKTMTLKATDGNLFIKKSKFGYGGEYAFIAVSETSGLPQTMIKDPAVTTTLGMGEQLLQAKHLGKKKIILCLGGSSTNDGGAGLVHALGGVFFNDKNEPFLPTGGTLKDIKKIDLKNFFRTIDGMEFITLCDVKNPLLGLNGCSYIYAPQKGAKTDDKIRFLEENMEYFAEITSFLGIDPTTPGAGAAGGLGYCAMAFLRSKIISGIDFVLDKSDFFNAAEDVDYIITGEGKFDQTSLRGKVVSGVLERAEKIGKKVVVFCGDGENSERCQVIPINDPNLSLCQNIENTENNLKKAIGEFLAKL